MDERSYSICALQLIKQLQRAWLRSEHENVKRSNEEDNILKYKYHAFSSQPRVKVTTFQLSIPQRGPYNEKYLA